jgi:ubiquinone/menaquinone biosynthesis C-methylase UbiE
MANKFYALGEERADRVQDLFATIAPRYDLINDLQSFGLHRYWKSRLLRLAQLKPGERALDLCCGTGDLAFAMARLGAQVAGLDFSAPMLSVARQRSQGAEVKSPKSGITKAGQLAPSPNSDFCPLSSVLFLRGDALRIPCRDSQFDVVTIGYGLRNLANFRNGLSEMWRVVRPGGRLLILDFGKPDNGLWRRCYFTYLRWIVPAFGRIFCGDSETHAYILESLQKYPAQNGVAAAMAEMDCEQIRIIKLLGGVMSINYGMKRLE